ncbi:MAG: twin transmembrane helix small protein [Rhodospirillales bacterium]|nr:twin transmembrane helix small protein [Rhodospirillales bacterium]MDP6772958.1 twin transmembrane helix small protein [Rhodospirillales bacterium]
MLPYLVGIFAATTALVLFTGLYAMSAEGTFNEKYSNVLMRWRVGLQGVTLALLALFFLLTDST